MGSNAVAFKDWANSDGVTTSAPIEQLKGARLGIDAEDYINSILVVTQREPLLPALGGLPFGFHKRVSEDLKQFREADITPVFIFNGLDLACRDRASVFRDSRRAEKALNEAWSIYDDGKPGPAVDAFGRAILYRSEHIVNNTKVYLHKQGVFTQTAPYSAAPQLAYMERDNFVDAVAGSVSCLVFGIEKVITSFDWNENNAGENKSFNWVALARCLTKLGLTRDQFINVCLLSGCSILPTLPDIDSDSPNSKIPAARNFLTRIGLDSNSLLHSLKDDHYRDLFMKARFAIKHPVILLVDGRVEPVNWETGPSDAHAFIGQRLPDEVLAYLTAGLVGPRMLNWRTRMELLETQPLDGGDSDAYKRLLQDKLRPLRSQTLALIARHLHRYYQKNDVELICYWNEAAKIPLNIADQADATNLADNWHIKTKGMGSQPRSNAAKTPLLFAVNLLAKDTEAKKTVTPRAEITSPLREKEELSVNTVCRFLESRGYINPDHTLSAWGKALKTSLDRATADGLAQHSITDSEIEEAIFMAFELLRFDVLNSNTMFPLPTYSGAPGRGSEADRAKTLLVSRIACLAAFHHAEIGYTGPLSRHLLAYHQTAAAVRGALRDLLEMHACNMLMSNSVDRRLEKSEYRDFGASLPLLNEPDVGLALIVKTHLEELLLDADKPRNHVGKWFIHASDIEGDLEKAWKLWDAINAGVQAADAGIVTAEIKDTFRNTDEWLSEKRKQPHPEKVPNGTS